MRNMPFWWLIQAPFLRHIYSVAVKVDKVFMQNTGRIKTDGTEKGGTWNVSAWTRPWKQFRVNDFATILMFWGQTAEHDMHICSETFKYVTLLQICHIPHIEDERNAKFTQEWHTFDQWKLSILQFLRNISAILEIPFLCNFSNFLRNV